jgi:AbrB family looped-hinge helix DNA binding protein
MNKTKTKGVDMELIKVKKNFQVTLPSNLRKRLNIQEGDYLNILEKNGGFVIKPMKMIPADEAYFHTKKWQKGEAQADKDLKTGNVQTFNNIEDLIKDLDS